jgi:lantibiotic modifying enzyme
MRTFADADEDSEILYGNAGAILALNSLYSVHPDPEVIEIMRQCGQRILAQARPMAQGVGWYSKSLGTIPLAGFSHGASGIATALEVLYRRTGQGAYLEAAQAALVYERSLFSPEHGNWRDIRSIRPEKQHETPLPDRFPVVWCNGAPGVGMARLRMRSLDDAATRREIEVALETTRREGFGYTHSICHGDLGNLEFLFEADAAGFPLTEKNEVEQRAAWILEGIRRKGWVCGTPRGVETPSLMTGLAGIGYGFLRLYDTAGTPSMLMLDPPR